MEIGRIKLSKSDLENIPEDERFVFIQTLNVLNDINVFQKILVYSISENEGLDEVVQKGQNTLTICILYILVGKIFEGWEFFKRDYFTKLFSKDHLSLLSNEQKNSLKFLKTFFGKKNIFYKIRNYYGFHYSTEELKGHYEELDIDDMELFICKVFGNWFSTSHGISLRGIFREMDSDYDDQKIGEYLKDLFKEITVVGKNYQIFVSGIINVVCKKYSFENIIIEIPKPESIGSIDLPFFIDQY